MSPGSLSRTGYGLSQDPFHSSQSLPIKIRFVGVRIREPSGKLLDAVITGAGFAANHGWMEKVLASTLWCSISTNVQWRLSTCFS